MSPWDQALEAGKVAIHAAISSKPGCWQAHALPVSLPASVPTSFTNSLTRQVLPKYSSCQFGSCIWRFRWALP
jgi:hypothetical protein